MANGSSGYLSVSSGIMMNTADNGAYVQDNKDQGICCIQNIGNKLRIHFDYTYHGLLRNFCYIEGRNRISFVIKYI